MWFIIYSVAIFLDIVGIIIGVLGVGLIINRVIGLLAGPSFAFVFYVSGVKGWGWRTLLGSVTEEVPFIGDFLPAWTITVWRVHRADAAIRKGSEINEGTEGTSDKGGVVAQQQEQDEAIRQPQGQEA